MCLHLSKNAKVETSPVNIVVYKRLNEKGRAPYRHTKYYQGELKTVPEFSGFDEKFTHKIPAGVDTVYHGLHVYVTKRKAMQFQSSLIVECVIPRRTPFIRGKNGQIVTLKLRIGKAVGYSFPNGRWSDQQFYAKKFNTRKRKVSDQSTH